ncbi:polysaccharide deacetylase family protein [Methylobacterium sp. BTF04]|uniref:polysaccharide deacetylase family protein n=1 Tax=Methylobacterium sp. BTF04 TaxID=2708300 RepID=UPI001FF07C2C|nr:polysaccharide deacetylase family protein [Methylobacterium sp. BTF04]
MIRDTPLLRETALRLRAITHSVATAPSGLYVLCYHHIPAAWQARFEAQLRFLGRHGTFVDADRAADLVATGGAATGRFFLVSFDDGYTDSCDVALPVLTALGIPAIVFLVSDWLDAPPVSAGRRDGYMTRADVETWCEAGLQIGSHSATHRNLKHLTPDAITEEMTRSRHALEALTGRPIRHFACPWGVAGRDFDPASDPALAAAAGYRTFHTTRRGQARSAADLLLLPRHVLEPQWDLYQLDALLGGRANHAGH